MTFATQADAKDTIWVLINSTVPNDTDAIYKSMGTFSTGNKVFADYYFDNLESCRRALKGELLWNLQDEHKVLENNIKSNYSPNFVTTWSNGKLFYISQCKPVSKK